MDAPEFKSLHDIDTETLTIIRDALLPVVPRGLTMRQFRHPSDIAGMMTEHARLDMAYLAGRRSIVEEASFIIKERAEKATEKKP